LLAVDLHDQQQVTPLVKPARILGLETGLETSHGTPTRREMI